MSTVIQDRSVVIDDGIVDVCADKPIGNSTFIVEIQNLVVGDMSDLLELIGDSQIAATRSGEETESAENVFSALGV